MAAREKVLLVKLPKDLSSVCFFLDRLLSGLPDVFPPRVLLLSTGGGGVIIGFMRRLLGGVTASFSAAAAAFLTLTPEGPGTLALVEALLLGMTSSASSAAVSTGGAALLEGPTSSAAPASTASLKDNDGFLVAGAGLQSRVRKKSRCRSGSRATESPTAPIVCKRPLGDLDGDPTAEPEGVDMADVKRQILPMTPHT